MKLLRIILLIIVLVVSIFSWRQVYIFVYELLDFQIGLYEMALEWGQQLDAVKDTVWWLFDQALWAIGIEWDLWAIVEDKKDLEAKIQWFQRKLQIASAVAGLLVWLFIAKVLYGVLFGFNNFLDKIQTFLR